DRVVVDLGDDLVVADANAVPVEEALRLAAADGHLGVVHVDAVRRRVDDVVAAASEVDARVPAGQIAAGIRQHPVTAGRTADRAAGRPELHRAAFAELLAERADNLQTQSHTGRPCALSKVMTTG